MAACSCMQCLLSFSHALACSLLLIPIPYACLDAPVPALPPSLPLPPSRPSLPLFPSPSVPLIPCSSPLHSSLLFPPPGRQSLTFPAGCRRSSHLTCRRARYSMAGTGMRFSVSRPSAFQQQLVRAFKRLATQQAVNPLRSASLYSCVLVPLSLPLSFLSSLHRSLPPSLPPFFSPTPGGATASHRCHQRHIQPPDVGQVSSATTRGWTATQWAHDMCGVHYVQSSASLCLCGRYPSPHPEWWSRLSAAAQALCCLVDSVHRMLQCMHAAVCLLL